MILQYDNETVKHTDCIRSVLFTSLVTALWVLAMGYGALTSAGYEPIVPITAASIIGGWVWLLGMISIKPVDYYEDPEPAPAALPVDLNPTTTNRGIVWESTGAGSVGRVLDLPIDITVDMIEDVATAVLVDGLNFSRSTIVQDNKIMSRSQFRRFQEQLIRRNLCHKLPNNTIEFTDSGKSWLGGFVC